MPFSLTVCDESNLGDRRPAITLQLPEPTITVRELIRARVFEEVKAYNEASYGPYRGLVHPAPEEQALNPPKSEETRRKVDWHHQAQVALEAFDRNGFLLFVDGQQVESLAEEIRLRSETEVVFLKLTPLVGG
jgi:hypothetical protein